MRRTLIPLVEADNGFSATACTARPTGLNTTLRATTRASTATATMTRWFQRYGWVSPIPSQEGGVIWRNKGRPPEPPVNQAKRLTNMGKTTATLKVTGPR